MRLQLLETGIVHTSQRGSLQARGPAGPPLSPVIFGAVTKFSTISQAAKNEQKTVFF